MFKIEEKKLALVATGTDSGAFLAWGTRAVGSPNTRQWSTGKEFLDYLVSVGQNESTCIKKLYIFSHGWRSSDVGNRGGVYAGGPPSSGFYSSEQYGDDPDARYVEELRMLVNQGNIKFCRLGEIIFTGCRITASDFPAQVASITGCSVIASNGASFPRPAGQGRQSGDVTGEWVSNASSWEEQQAASQGKYFGWIKYTPNPQSGQVTMQQIGYKTNGGGSIIRLW